MSRSGETSPPATIADRSSQEVVLYRRRATVRWWIPRLVMAVVIGLSSGLAIDVWRVGGWQAWQIRHRLPPLYVASGSTFEVNGSRTYLDCRGAGSPTVLLEAGFGTGAAGWGFVLDWVAAQTRVCAWDRPGIGGSDPIGSHTLEDAARRLRTTLAAAGEEPPFIAVGHSLGAVYARVFASTFRPEVRGVVLVDPYLPDIRPVEHVTLDPALREDWLAGLRATNERVAAGENLDWAASYDELTRASIEGLPLELLFVDQRFRWEGPFEPAEGDLIAAWRRLLGGLSAEYRLTIAEDSTHMIQFDRPDLVVDAIIRLVDRARAGVGAAQGATLRSRWPGAVALDRARRHLSAGDRVATLSAGRRTWVTGGIAFAAIRCRGCSTRRNRRFATSRSATCLTCPPRIRRS